MELRTSSGIISTDGDIIYCRLLPDIDQSIEMAQENLLALSQISKGRKFPLLLDIRLARPSRPEVRRYYFDREVTSSYFAMGVLVEESPFGQAFSSLYSRLSQTGVQKRVFTDERECRSWLKNFQRP